MIPKEHSNGYYMTGKPKEDLNRSISLSYIYAKSFTNSMRRDSH